MPDADKYTICWICATSIQLAAARSMLEEIHDETPNVYSSDDNNYVLGSIGKHEVVITCLPYVSSGPPSVNRVVKDLLRSFPNLRFGLFVGIGGGAPSQRHDIRLGDVVVSRPHRGRCGFLQYDFDSTLRREALVPAGPSHDPPAPLLSAMIALESEHFLQGNQLAQAVNRTLDKFPNLRKMAKRPEQSTDQLYEGVCSQFAEGKAADHHHTICDDSCSPGSVSRPPRSEDEDDPSVHYGLIASADRRMENSQCRDKLAAANDVLCFDVEAAGLTDAVPSLVIRGICDYSDSHKYDPWRGYAGMTAGAYARDLLLRVRPQIITPQKSGNTTSGVPFDPGKGEVASHTSESVFEHIRKPRRFFRKGRVFATVWAEPWSASNASAPPGQQSAPTRAFSKTRRFIVIHEGHGSSTCVPIHTYGGRGANKANLKLEDHAWVYPFGSDPPSAGHHVSLREPIGLVIEGSDDLHRLHPKSLANFGKLCTVEHNIAVANIGFVHKTHNNRLYHSLLPSTSKEGNTDTHGSHGSGHDAIPTPSVEVEKKHVSSSSQWGVREPKAESYLGTPALNDKSGQMQGMDRSLLKTVGSQFAEDSTGPSPAGADLIPSTYPDLLPGTLESISTGPSIIEQHGLTMGHEGGFDSGHGEHSLNEEAPEEKEVELDENGPSGPLELHKVDSDTLNVGGSEPVNLSHPRKRHTSHSPKVAKRAKY
ncbi:hypothetical protein N3K66_005312 [Trichothecium roseum]|uniref:Uncharacterized protein n=1 Tax=Trichothecium roseum TaxID=47278 RepID=A0ACC0UXL9_9HYPO|nr:hypothetical protein N3K66_005312 [Trichothecium roseum]